MPPKRKRSDNDSWRTPKGIFNPLNAEYKFFADVAASKENALCKRYLTIEDDALSINWGLHWIGPCARLLKMNNDLTAPEGPFLHSNIDFFWANVPFSDIERWLEKIIAEMQRGAGVVALVPYQSQAYWKELVIPYVSRIYMILGRVSFGDPETGIPQNNCKFATAVLVYDPRKYYDKLRHHLSLNPDTFWVDTNMKRIYQQTNLLRYPSVHRHPADA